MSKPKITQVKQTLPRPKSGLLCKHQIMKIKKLRKLLNHLYKKLFIKRNIENNIFLDVSKKIPLNTYPNFLEGRKSNPSPPPPKLETVNF